MSRHSVHEAAMDRAEREFRGTDRADDEVGVPAPPAPVLLRDAIVGYYLETLGKALDTQELAERVGWSVSRVRRVIARCKGAPPGIDARKIGFGKRERWAYLPSREHLVTIVKNLQQRVSELEEKASDFSDLPNGERWW